MIWLVQKGGGGGGEGITQATIKKSFKWMIKFLKDEWLSCIFKLYLGVLVSYHIYIYIKKN